MQIPRHIFKAYDVRGLIDSEITPLLAESIGRAFAVLLRRESPGKELTFAVGRDMRPNSLELQSSIIKGIRESGVHVLDIGLVSTPAFYFSVGYLKADGGVMISASHNSTVYNGFKFVRAHAIPVSGDTGIQDIANIVEQEAFVFAEQQGRIKTILEIPERAAEAEIDFAGQDSIRSLKIVADSANGMGAQYLDELFKRIPCDPIRLFWNFDGMFPNHEPNPLKEENVKQLKAAVCDRQADIGIATDGDGDRIFFVDDQGQVVEPAILRGLLAQIMLRRFPGATVCYDVRPGKVTEDMILEAGGRPLVTRVGHSFMKEQMRKVDAVFGGESSGHFFYRFPIGVFEGPLTVTVHLLQEMTKQRKTLSELVAPYKKYAHSGELNFRVSDKEIVLQQLKEHFADGVISELDGVTVTYPNFWFNVRASNTESLVRLNVEALNPEVMEEKKKEVVEILERS
ncbi:MAG: Phosphomannomutase [Candidatus Uhrbacteria bacterium GW2011_GWF2_41_16]|uniref:Phosphomannomutase n=2 Tax=Candidatus Uhriibacteriota TaxID=1752732 RepID=A0A0G0VC68_9BACT|nr:MAG: Phosphomannomutase [Candidatus Uhrbacteria bacterium GW2011_GWA2_41_10]KKR87558.1 MAG: Phosphomannomutase [Candidatus Uhrbacteria bacterium GW2011_GWC2_41_11]KKR98538.1 MAG: Phosphomannomutase [Candidatus Uhrbacteria bacterium GW2011_GWF2_41_16]HBO99925.1 phosphomannomutase/phosphoglucomutase [Candidatus Uhrbacteria bacterium]